MRGGYFNYRDCIVNEVADCIDDLIFENKKNQRFSQAVIEKFVETAKLFRQAGHMAHYIDWLVSDDIDEESFFERWRTIE